MEQVYEYKGKKYSRVGDTWLDRDRLLVSDLLAARLTMEVDGKPAPSPAEVKKATKAAARAASKASAAKAAPKTPKTPKAPAKSKAKKKAEVEEPSEE